jgi:hypothetical protein
MGALVLTLRNEDWLGKMSVAQTVICFAAALLCPLTLIVEVSVSNRIVQHRWSKRHDEHGADQLMRYV